MEFLGRLLSDMAFLVLFLTFVKLNKWDILRGIRGVPYKALIPLCIGLGLAGALVRVLS